MKKQQQNNKIKPPTLHSGHMEVAVVRLLNFRIYNIVPNVREGFLLNHEADLLCEKDRKLTEVEIKISRSDLKADFKKNHGHKDKKISRLVYAVPEKMRDLAFDLVPKECGIITVKWVQYNDSIGYYEAFWARHCNHKKDAYLLSDSEIINLLRLGCMRIWTLKAHNNKKTLKQKL